MLLAAIGVLMTGNFLVVVVYELLGYRDLISVAGLFTCTALCLSVFCVRWTRSLFIVVGIILSTVALVTRTDAFEIIEAGLRSATFIGAFFVALAWLRNAASTSPAMEKCGRYLASQPPGRRYAALSVGGHLFALVLNYGAINLLGAVAETSTRSEPVEELRRARLRRMLVAIQRGFVSTLTWSPLTFSLVISTTFVTGASWTGAVGYGVVSSLLLMAIGWGLDTLFKPKLSVPVPARKPAIGGPRSLVSLLILLSLLMTLIATGYALTDLKITTIVMLVVPVLSLGWIGIQNRRGPTFPWSATAIRALSYVTKELPNFRSELVLLIMAGFIGTVGAKLSTPYVHDGLNLFTAIPPLALLVSLIWIIPLAGQLGMNPILAVSLIAPMLPDAQTLGTSPNTIVTALTAGWALSGASSPFTATTLLVGAFGNTSAQRVGIVWNGFFTLVGALVLSVWVALLF